MTEEKQKLYYVFKYTNMNLVKTTEKAWGFAFQEVEQEIWWVPKSKSFTFADYFDRGLHGVAVPPWLVKRAFSAEVINSLKEGGYMIEKAI